MFVPYETPIKGVSQDIWFFLIEKRKISSAQFLSVCSSHHLNTAEHNSWVQLYQNHVNYLTLGRTRLGPIWLRFS